MATKITREVLEAYLNCKTKAHLKLAGQQGIRSDYEGLLAATRQEVRQQAIDKILARHAEGEVARDISLTAAALREGPSFVLDAILEDDLAVAPLRRVEEGGRAVEVGGLPLRPDAVPRGPEGRQGAKAPAGDIRPAPVPAPGETARQRDGLARAGVQGHEGSAQRRICGRPNGSFGKSRRWSVPSRRPS